jgi:uncharacterized protein (TIGR03435 family)
MTRAALILIGVVTALPLAAQEPTPRFDVASVKPNPSGDRKSSSGEAPGGSYNATNVPLPVVIRFAYDLQSYQLRGGPAWMETARFDISARAGRDASNSELQLMMRTLLADRFKLSVRKEQRQGPIFAMVLARSDGSYGSGLQRRPDACDTPRPRLAPPPVGSTVMEVPCASFDVIAQAVAGQMGVPVVDKTGLKGKWSLSVHYGPVAVGLGPPTNPNLPSFVTALEEQLGLRLESTRGPVEVFVIDSVERPTPD